jgi:hypothetical protein
MIDDRNNLEKHPAHEPPLSITRDLICDWAYGDNLASSDIVPFE